MPGLLSKTLADPASDLPLLASLDERKAVAKLELDLLSSDNEVLRFPGLGERLPTGCDVRVKSAGVLC